MLKIGEVIRNKYVVRELLGKGGMGTVYLCSEKGTEYLLAIKEIKKTKKYYNSEPSILKNLNNKGIPKIYEVFEDKNCLYMCIDYIEGETLKSRVLRKNIGELEFLRIALDITYILEYLHSLKPGIIYGDLKPDNIILKPNGEVVLIDFGISRIYKPEDHVEEFFEEMYMGSMGYAAPEQFGHGRISPATDIYGLGAVLYYMLLGKSPENALEAIKDNSYPEKLPVKFRYILRRAMQIDYEDRYSSINDFRRDLLSSRDFSKEYKLLSKANSMEKGKTIEFFRIPEEYSITNSNTQVGVNKIIDEKDNINKWRDWIMKHGKKIALMIVITTLIISGASLGVIYSLNNNVVADKQSQIVRKEEGKIVAQEEVDKAEEVVSEEFQEENHQSVNYSEEQNTAEENIKNEDVEEDDQDNNKSNNKNKKNNKGKNNKNKNNDDN